MYTLSVSKKATLLYQNFVKSPPFFIFGTTMAKTIKLSEMCLLFTSLKLYKHIGLLTSIVRFCTVMSCVSVNVFLRFRSFF